MNTNTLTTQELAALLREAEQAHKAYEKTLSAPDSDWSVWYADFIIRKLRSKPEKSTKPLTNGMETAYMGAEPDSRSLPDTGSLARARANTTGDSAALRVCPTCAHRNRPGTLLCDNCGTNLTTGQQAALGTRDLRDPESVEKPATGKLPGDKPSTDKQTVGAVPPSPASRLDSTEVRAIRTAGTSVFEESMILRIEIEGGAAPIVLKPEAKDMILGRRDPTTGAAPEVDLTSYAGYRMGVSRNHAALKLTDNQLNLWDMGSSNGTFLNGSRLSPHRPYPVRDGDEIRLGQMILRLFFQTGGGRRPG